MGWPVIWQGAVWWLIAMMWGSVASAAVHHKSSHPEVSPARQAKSAAIGDSTKQPDTPKQPNPNPPTPPVSPPDQKGNFEAVTAVAVGAIEAARHSTEESRKFYEWYAQLLIMAAGVLSTFGLVGGFWFLKYQAKMVAEEIATSKTNSLLHDIRIEFNKLRIEEETKLLAIQTVLNGHVETWGTFSDSTREFQKNIANDLEAFVTVVPKALEMAFWIDQYADKLPTDKTRVNPHALARALLKACERALTKDPKVKLICAYIYGQQGIAHRLLDNYSAARESLSNSLIYDPDNARTLRNLACSTCLLGDMGETKKYLQKAIALDPRLADEIQTDPDFTALRPDPNFLEILGKSD